MGKLSLLIPRHLQGCVCPALEDFGPCQRTAVCTRAHMNGPRPTSLINPKALRLEITGWSKQVGFFTGKVAMKHEEFSRFTHDRNESLLRFLQLPDQFFRDFAFKLRNSRGSISLPVLN